MSLNGFNGQQAGRLPVRPLAEPQNPQAQAQWPQQGQPQPQAQQQAQWGQQAQQGYGAAPQNQGYAPQQVAPASGYGGLSASPDPYAPSFEPYTPVTAAPQRAAQPAYQPPAPQQTYQPQAAQTYAQQGYGAPDPRLQPQQQWSPQAAPAAARGFDAGNYLSQQVASPTNANYRGADPRHHDSEPALSDWTNGQHAQSQQQGGHTQGGQGYEFGDAHGGHNDMGFAQAAGGELEQGYAEEDGPEYEAEETGRSRRPMMIAAALAGAIVIGAGFSYGYKSFLGGGATGNPPMVKSSVEPSKTKPADAGGKQFAHSDSKIMGRLGDGSAPAAGAEADANGSRKVSTLVVGRDGSIQAPVTAPVEAAAAAPAAPAAAAPIADGGVPGMMVVDALGTNKVKTAAAAVAGGANAAQAAVQQVAAVAPPAQKVIVTPPPAAKALPEATGSIEPQAAAPTPAPKKVKKVAAAAPAVVNDAATAAAPSVASGGTNGFVAVLASVPKSGSSRIDALKRFADMQQKYGNVLGGKTPDVAEANLGAKGAYHRLVVGPPGSREQASTVCSQLKSQGYADCWVTSY
jgi:SPOR domain